MMMTMTMTMMMMITTMTTRTRTIIITTTVRRAILSIFSETNGKASLNFYSLKILSKSLLRNPIFY